MKRQSTIVVLLLCLGTLVWAQNDPTDITMRKIPDMMSHVHDHIAFKLRRLQD